MNDEQKQARTLLRNATGQIEAATRMLDEDRYCVDVSTQILAAEALLRKANLLILRQHVSHCVRTAIEQGDAQDKLSEVMMLVEKMSR